MKLTLPTVCLPVVVTLYPTYIKKRDNIITIISVSINLERERGVELIPNFRGQLN